MRRLTTLILLLLCTALHAQWLVPYRPEGEPKAAVVVCPGGSYFWLDKEGEGSLVAEWLASEGIAAYVLHYRTGGWWNFT
ncbi:MAG: alpha/beta hydrolase, partial [Bacteroidales bacterium]|nr:alpha/beta hydrolase [Bacteroidales bacterium]